MPNYRRDQTPGGTWFFTVVAFKRRPIFCCENFRNTLRQSILKTQENHPFKVDAWILLPDHLHCVWTLPKNDANFSIRWKLIKQYVSHDLVSYGHKQTILSATKRKRRESSIWQPRFWEHRIRNNQDYANHLNYLHYNPVKHGLCQSPAEWPYSSFHKFLATGVYSSNWGTTKPTEIGQFGE